MKLWPPKPGLTDMDQQQVDIVNMGQGRLNRGGRIDGDAGLLALGPDGLEGAVQMRAGLGMDGDDIGAGPGEGGI